MEFPTAGTLNHRTTLPFYQKERTTVAQNTVTDAGPNSGKQVPARPHDSGSAANETVDGLDATTEALRKAVEDAPSGATPEDSEEVPVFDRAGLPPKI